MGLLDKLWDDVVAGPMPEQGLGRLRHPVGLHHHHHHHEPVPAGEKEREAMARLLQRRRSADFQREQEEARRVTEETTTGMVKKPPNLSLLRTTSLPTASDSDSAPTTPLGSATSPTSGGTPRSVERYNVWRSVFNPGSNKAMQKIGAQEKFDQAQPNSPTVYDWLYSGETKSTWR